MKIIYKGRIVAVITLMFLLLTACSENGNQNGTSDGVVDSGETASENLLANQSENLTEEHSGVQAADQMVEGEIICENPYFFPRNISFLTADITYIDIDEIASIKGNLELHWLKQYENGCIAKLSLLSFDDMPSYILDGSPWAEDYEYCNIYFYVTPTEIYRINGYVIQEDEYIYAYEDEKLFIDYLDSDEEIVENAELVCCPEGKDSEYTGENIGETTLIGEVGTHYEIVISENQITYRRHEYPHGNLEFYNTFVWEMGRGLIEHKMGYRAGAMILYMENISTWS